MWQGEKKLSLFDSVIRDLMYIIIVGGFLVLVWAFFTKKKPGDVLRDMKEWLFSESDG